MFVEWAESPDDFRTEYKVQAPIIRYAYVLHSKHSENDNSIISSGTVGIYGTPMRDKVVRVPVLDGVSKQDRSIKEEFERYLSFWHWL